MELARRVYSRDLKIKAMQEIDAGRTVTEVARRNSNEFPPAMLL